MLINLKSVSPVLVMTSSMSVPFCNRFHTIRYRFDTIAECDRRTEGQTDRRPGHG